MLTVGNIIAIVVLIVLITAIDFAMAPGLIFTLPGNNKWISTFTPETNYWAIVVHGLMKFVANGFLIGGFTFLLIPFIETLTK